MPDLYEEELTPPVFDEFKDDKYNNLNALWKEGNKCRDLLKKLVLSKLEVKALWDRCYALNSIKSEFKTVANDNTKMLEVSERYNFTLDEIYLDLKEAATILANLNLNGVRCEFEQIIDQMIDHIRSLYGYVKDVDFPHNLVYNPMLLDGICSKIWIEINTLYKVTTLADKMIGILGESDEILKDNKSAHHFACKDMHEPYDKVYDKELDTARIIAEHEFHESVQARIDYEKKVEQQKRRLKNKN